MAITKLHSLALLLWKNALLQKRRVWMTTAQIGFPILFFAILALLRLSVSRQYGDAQSFCSQAVAPDDYYHALMDSAASWGYPTQTTCIPSSTSMGNLPWYGYNAIAFTPDTPAVRSVLSLFLGSVKIVTENTLSLSLVPFNSNDEMEATIVDSSNPKYLFGVVFQLDDNGSPGGLGLQGPKVHYQLRFADDYMTQFSNTQSDGELWGTEDTFFRVPRTNPRTQNAYTNSYFTVIQQLMDSALLQYLHPQNVSSPVMTRLKPLAFPSYLFSKFLNALGNTFSLMVVLAFLFSAATIIRELTFEKEKRLREAMRILGVSDKMHWLGHFVWQLLFLIVIVLIISAILIGGNVVEKSTFGFTFLFFLVFGCTVIFFCFFMSSLFSTANVATAFGTLFFFLFYVPFLFIMRPEVYGGLSRGSLIGLCILPQTCMGIGTKIWVNKEASGIGMSVNNMADTATDADNLTMAGVFGMLVFDCFLYGFLAWYMENAFPGEYGMPRPWYFFLQPSYYFSFSKRRSSISQTPLNDANPVYSVVEQLPPQTKYGIEIDHVTKEFDGVGGIKVAVDNLNVKFVKDRINILLGHNGAGKTTTMSMLVGYFPGTRGEIRIGSSNVFENVIEARSSLGFCPQFDVLFESLSVREHLWLFGQLKGLEGENLQNEIESFIDKLGIRPKADSQVRVLSGGQRRAVSVSLALIGKPETVILDEPTSGMDTYKRRQTWDLLLSERAGRTILLSTHDMEEAEVLGDYIAIMAEGSLRVMGSPLFLKQRFGFGYELTLLRSPNATVPSDDITALIATHVPDAYLKDEVGAELKYLLPKDQANKFAGLMNGLEENRSQLQIASEGVTVTTLEEIFLNVASATPTPEGMDPRKMALAGRTRSTTTTTTTTTRPTEYQPKYPQVGLQFPALFKKRVLQWRRSIKLMLVMFFLPLVLAIIGLAIVNNLSTSANEPSLLFGLVTGYPSNVVLYSDNDYGGDHYSGAYLSTANALGVAGTRTPNTLQTQLKSSLQSLLGVDPRYSISSFQDIGGNNMTSYILNAGTNYYSNLFYRKHVAAVSSQPGPLRIKYINNTCALRVGNTYISSPPVNLAVGQTYEFVLEKDGNGEMFTLSTSSTNAYGSELSYTTNSASYYTKFEQQYLGLVRVTIPQGTQGSVYYLFCGIGQTSGSIQATVVSDPSTAVQQTGATMFAWFSVDPYPSAPAALNLATNLAASVHIGPDTKIYTYNNPLPKPPQLKVQDTLNGDAIVNLGVFFMMIAGFLGPCFSLFPVDERVSKAKHIQLVSGASRVMFWASSFVFDYIAYLITALAIFIVFCAANLEQFSGAQLGYVFLLLVIFGFSLIPFIYLLSFLFKDSSAAFSRLVLVLTMVGLGGIFAVLITARPSFGLDNYSPKIKWALLILPQFSFVQGLIDLFDNYSFNKICTISSQAMALCGQNGYFPNNNYLGWADPGIGRQIFFMFLTAILSWIGIALIESWPAVSAALRLRTRFVLPRQEADDPDVAAERSRAEVGDGGKDVVRAVGLSKAFMKEKQPFYAVKNISFAIPYGECFGLLGVNGAGKSTTFSLLTGEQATSDGAAYIAGYNVYSQRSDASRFMGFCPQFDGLLPLLTGREHLFLYAALRGVPVSEAKSQIETLLDELNLQPVANKLAGTYSGGNKRRLATAVALLGNHPVIFLDEPTTGVDPKARREMWNFLSTVIRSGRSIVLTSHSMAECEALCTRLSIMVDGRLKALGTLQHLKSRYGNGYKVTIKFNANNAGANLSAAKEHMNSKYNNPTLLHEHNGELEYQVKGVSVGNLFEDMEDLKTKLPIEDYGICQTTLEQVFINFAKPSGPSFDSNEKEPSGYVNNNGFMETRIDGYLDM